MKSPPRIILIEDDYAISQNLTDFLIKEGFHVENVYTGNDAIQVLEKNKFDLLILDVNLPGFDGYYICQEFRKNNTQIPILMLTAYDELEDKMKGFDVGADDYLTKPFSMEVLVARMEAILRRSHTDKSVPGLAEEIALGNYTYTPGKMRLCIGETELKFTPKENELMKLLCENLGRPVSRSYALKLIWGDDTYFNARSMDVYMTKLRKMLKEDPRVQLLNLHGEGFRLSVEGL